MPARKKTSSRKRESSTRVASDAAALERMIGDPQLISGVHNYCDRWCERCPLTARCLVYKMEHHRRSRRAAEDGRTDDQNQDFWDNVADSFALALTLVQREAAKLGIDLNDPATLAPVEAEERRRRRVAARQGSALRRAAASYRKAAMTILERLTPQLESTQESLDAEARLEIGHPQATAAAIVDALEVVQWYLFFLDVKLQRAVASRVDRDADGDDGFPSDADGSAKIALIAINRSIGAWARLRTHLPDEADAILDLLVQLERLRRAAEREFPNARAFMRPGFDCPAA